MTATLAEQLTERQRRLDAAASEWWREFDAFGLALDDDQMREADGARRRGMTAAQVAEALADRREC